MEKVKEFISYGIVGVMTTLVNYIVYCICLKIGIDWLTSNSFAWMVAVIFAYFSNRKVVFHSSNDMKKECIEFFGLRFMTLLVENLLLAICIDGVHISNLLSKILVHPFGVSDFNVLSVVSNQITPLSFGGYSDLTIFSIICAIIY